MSNSTPLRLDELLASGEDLCDGLNSIGVAVGITENPFAAVRASLDALIGTNNLLKAAEGAQPDSYTALRTADSNGKSFIAAALKVLRISLGEEWSDAWLATGLPDNKVRVPNTQDGRFTALGGLKAYFTANPAAEVSTPKITVTAALAQTLFTAVSGARSAVNTAVGLTKDRLLAKNVALEAFRKRYRDCVDEIGRRLSDEDPRWYDFGLNRPGDPAQPGQPSNVQAANAGSGAALVIIDGARRANSFNYYKQVNGVDAEPVKVENTQGTQFTFTGLPVGATVSFTVTGVNDAGEGNPSTPVQLVIT